MKIENGKFLDDGIEKDREENNASKHSSTMTKGLKNGLGFVDVLGEEMSASSFLDLGHQGDI